MQGAAKLSDLNTAKIWQENRDLTDLLMPELMILCGDTGDFTFTMEQLELKTRVQYNLNLRELWFWDFSRTISLYFSSVFGSCLTNKMTLQLTMIMGYSRDLR